MKLNEIKNVNDGYYDLIEGVIPVHISMTLEQVRSAGRVTNPVQHFVMAGLVSMFKDGGPSRWPRDINSYDAMTFGTASAVLEDLRAMTDAQTAELADWLLKQLQYPASFESNPHAAHAAPSMNTVDWVRWVLRRQD